MSKGNVILGQARGSVGDVTFYRAYGEQIARSRNRHPRNPKTSAQKVQRAVMATALRAYSLGKNIFDHSFEGVGVGMPSMRRFLSQNVKLMRTSIVGALNGGTVSPYRVAAPGVNIPIANAYVVSSGTLQQTYFTYGAQGYAIPAVGDATTIAEYVAANQLQEGDIFTFVGFFAKPTDPAIEYVDPVEGPIEGMCIAQCYFGYEQLMVKTGAASDDTAISAETELSAIFEVIGSYAPTSVVISQKKLGEYVTIGDLGQPDYVGAWGVIMSREASGLRSNCTLNVEGADNLFGITTPYLIRAWSSEGSYADPSLILEGSNFNRGLVPAPVSPLFEVFADYNATRRPQIGDTVDTLYVRVNRDLSMAEIGDGFNYGDPSADTSMFSLYYDSESEGFVFALYINFAFTLEGSANVPAGIYGLEASQQVQLTAPLVTSFGEID